MGDRKGAWKTFWNDVGASVRQQWTLQPPRVAVLPSVHTLCTLFFSAPAARRPPVAPSCSRAAAPPHKARREPEPIARSPDF